ncbi:MAG: hypothetical protein KY464_13540 [Gemmatimonadetes bacterium]|nr:hypothetical protein [Gemmatimonadota bacterium]
MAARLGTRVRAVLVPVVLAGLHLGCDEVSGPSPRLTAQGGYTCDYGYCVSGEEVC